MKKSVNTAIGRLLLWRAIKVLQLNYLIIIFISVVKSVEILSEKTMNKAVIFTRFSRMADILKRELGVYNPSMITGAVTDRAAEIDKFNNDDTCKLIIITTAGNEGLNLQRANILYFYDVPLGSYGSLVQTIGRIKRIGQERPMVVYYLQAAGTVDQKLKKLLLKKKDASEQLFGSWQDIKDVL